jgi:hypothetical protein
MRIKDGFSLRPVMGHNIVIAEGIQNVDFNKVISMNETAAFLWNSLQDRDFTVDDMVDCLMDAYEVDEKTARADVEKTAKSWVENGLCEGN